MKKTSAFLKELGPDVKSTSVRVTTLHQPMVEIRKAREKASEKAGELGRIFLPLEASYPDNSINPLTQAGPSGPSHLFCLHCALVQSKHPIQQATPLTPHLGILGRDSTTKSHPLSLTG